MKKSRAQRYEEAVERNLSNLERYVSAKNKGGWAPCQIYLTESIERVKTCMGIRKSDNSYDYRLSRILKKDASWMNAAA